MVSSSTDSNCTTNYSNKYSVYRQKKDKLTNGILLKSKAYIHMPVDTWYLKKRTAIHNGEKTPFSTNYGRHTGWLPSCENLNSKWIRDLNNNNLKTNKENTRSLNMIEKWWIALNTLAQEKTLLSEQSKHRN